MPATPRTAVYLEVGGKRVFAGALGWPGWCRAGRSEDAALQALLDAAPRYARALEGAGLDFAPPGAVTDFTVAERLQGGPGTGFGVPEVPPAADAAPLDAAALTRLLALLDACWRAFDAAAAAAGGRELRKGPRGGGREAAAIVRHVLDSEAGYLSALGRGFRPGDAAGPAAEALRLRAAVREGLAAAARGEIPPVGPRGGRRWSPRYFVRRAAWHLLDHAWEIEDRLV